MKISFNINLNKKFFQVTFGLYILFIVLFIILKFNGRGSFTQLMLLRENLIKYEVNNINLNLFQNISKYLQIISVPYAFKIIMGNSVAFIPLGFFISILFAENNFVKTMSLSLIVILIIELTQYIFKIGFFDIDDIFLMTCGALIGYLISKLFVRLQSKVVE